MYGHKSIFTMKSIFLLVKNGNDRNHLSAIINKKGNRRNETDDERNTQNTLKLRWVPVTGPKLRRA